MDGEETESLQTSLAEERLRLEREALALERERLAAARAHAEAEARLTVKVHRPFLVIASVTLLALFCFLAGFLSGKTLERRDQRQQREQTIARALSQLEDITAPKSASSTNSSALPSPSGGRTPADAHRNVSVVVIQ